MIEALEPRLLLSSAGVTITSAQPSSWNVYASTTIDCDFSFNWWQGTLGGGTTKTLVVGIRDLSGHWVSGTTPLALMQDNPPSNSPGDGWGTGFSSLYVPAAPGTYLVVAAEEPTAVDGTAETDFTLGAGLAFATVGTLTTTACSPGMTISNVSQTSWNTAIGNTIGGSFSAQVWNGTASPNDVEDVVVGIRDSTGHWAVGSEPQVLTSLVPPIGSPGENNDVSFSGLGVPTQPGQYNVVAAEEPDADGVLAFEASADLATVPIGTLTAGASPSVWGPLLPFQTWDQSGPIAYGSSVNFNDDCPMDPATGERSVTGCVATVNGELAYYWRSLTSLSFSAADAYVSSAGTSSAVQIDGDATGDSFPNFAALNSGLANIVYNSNPSQLALLDFGLGVKAQADYSFAGTAASIDASWLQNLGYSSAAWSSDWNTVKPAVIANIQAGEPVIVDFPGHMALIDGYNQSSDQFHVVLGWGGSDDGWYTLPNASVFPGTTTTGEIDEIDYDLKPAAPLAASLAVGTQPTNITTNTGFPISVWLKDITGAAAISDQSTVTLAVLSGPSGGALNGNVSAPAVNGTAQFSGLSLSKPGTYTLAISDAADGLSGYATGTITVALALTLTPDTLGAGTYGAPFTESLGTVGGAGSVTLAVSAIQNAVAGLNVPLSAVNSLNLTGTPTGTGTETFTVTATDADGGTATASFYITVNPAALTVTTDPQGKTYGQADPTLTGTISGVVSGDGITVSYGTAATLWSDPGSYAISANLNDPNNRLSNYTVINGGNTLTIGRANQTIVWAAPAAITYGTLLTDTQLNATVSGVAGGSAPGTLAYGPSAGALLAAGSPNLMVTAAATTDYNQAVKYVTQTVNQAPLTVTGVTAADKVYNGTTTATLGLGGAALAGVISADAGSVTLITTGATGTFASPNASGGLTVTVSGLTLGGISAGNYTLTQPTTTADITAKDLTVTGTTAANKVYDGTTAAALGWGGAALAGLVSGDSGKVTLVTSGATGTFASPNASGGLTVTVSGLTLGGISAGNYTLTQPTTTADITAKDLTVTGTTAANKVYDGTTAAALGWGGAALAGLVSGDSGKVTLVTSGATGTFASPNASGGLTVTVSGLTLGGISAGNYTLTQPTTTADITAKDLTVTGTTAANKVYDGTTAAALGWGGAALAGLVSGDSGKVTLVTSGATGTFASPNASGGLTVTVSGLTLGGISAGNYTLTQPTTTADITAKDLTVTGTTAANKVYDGTTAAALGWGGAALAGLVSGDSGKVTLVTSGATGTFASPNASGGLTVTVSGLTLGGISAGNYTLTQLTTTADITAKDLTVTGTTAANKVYDGTTAAALGWGGAALAGLVSGDSGKVTLVTSGATGTFASPNASGGLTVTVSGLTLGGISAGNYTLTQPTTTADITAKDLTVTGTTAANKVYDGTTAAALGWGGAALAGLVSGDSGKVTLVTSGATGTFASPNASSGLAVTVSGLTLGGISAGNYTLTQPTTTASITARPITVTANAQTKTYGAGDPALTYQIASGSLVNGDNFTGGLTRAAGEHVGAHAIQQGSLTAGGNYNLSYGGANLTISPAPLTITADNQTKVYGAVLPVLTVRYSGLVNGDTAASLTTQPTATTTATVLSDVTRNPYNIAASGAVDNDYSITYVPGMLTVTPAPLAIVQQPGTTVVGKTASPGIKVALEDGLGNILTKIGGQVTVAIASGPAGGLLKGTATAAGSNGVASFTNLTFTIAGNYTLQFTDSLGSDTVPAAYGLTVAQGVVTVPVPVAVAAGYTYGKAISLSTTFKSTAPATVPFTGTASLVRNDGTVLATAALTAAGAAKFTFTAPPAAYTCTIQYPGDVNQTAATSSAFTFSSTPAATSTTLKTSVSSLYYGLPVTLTATVTSSNAPGTARTGTITFMDGGVAIGTVGLDGASTATLPISTPTVGSHTYTAAYSGDLIFKPSAAGAKTVTIKKDTVKATVVPAVGALVPGQAVTLTAHVVVTAGVNAPTGLVTFKDGSKILGTAALDGTDTATWQTTFTTAGTHSITASYGGDGQTNAATSTAAKFVVAKAATQVAFNSPNSTIAAGTATPFTIQVTALSPAVLVPTGKVVIKDGTKTLATLALVGGQVSWMSPLALGAGVHNLTAAYLGDANDLTSLSSSFMLTVG